MYGDISAATLLITDTKIYGLKWGMLIDIIAHMSVDSDSDLCTELSNPKI
jgi:hypothetical protein